MLNNAEAGAAGTVRSVRRVLQILEYFARERKPATLSEIARALGLPKSSCLALLSTLKSAGYLYEVSPREGYYPTRQWLDRATEIAAADPLSRIVRPVMEALHEQTGETVVLAQRVDDSSCYIDVIESNQTIRYTAEAGQRRPLHATATGKALLAALPANERGALLRRMPLLPLAPATIVDRALLEADLARGRARGWFTTEGETESDVTGVAVALRMGGEPYAIVVAGPSYRLSSRIEAIASVLQSATARLNDEIPPPRKAV